MIVCWWWISTQLSKLCCFICSRAKGESTVCVCIGCTCECLICFSVSRLCIDDLMYRTWKLLCVCLHVCDSIMWKSLCCLLWCGWKETEKGGEEWMQRKAEWDLKNMSVAGAVRLLVSFISIHIFSFSWKMVTSPIGFWAQWTSVWVFWLVFLR